MVLLFIFRVTKVRQNQLQSIYMPFLSCNALEMLWISYYYID